MKPAAIAVIPARGGSKRIPRKNIRLFAGRPMIAWAIDACIASGLFQRTIVSTDDPEIASVARSCGAETPFERPPQLADDHSGTGEVMAHAACWLNSKGDDGTALCCVYPTAPFVDAADLLAGWAKLRAGNWAYVIAATAFRAPVYRGFRMDDDGSIAMLFPQHASTRSQDLPTVLHDAGQFYWGHPQAWINRRPGLGADSTAVLVPSWRVQDIDDEDDWCRAELMAPAIWGMR